MRGNGKINDKSEWLVEKYDRVLKENIALKDKIKFMKESVNVALILIGADDVTGIIPCTNPCARDIERAVGILKLIGGDTE